MSRRVAAERLVTWGTLALVLFAPLAVGTVDRWSWGTVTVGAGLLLGLCSSFRLPSIPFSLTVPGLLLSGLALWTLVQAVPLPMAIVELLSPKAAEIRAVVLPTAVHGTPWAPLTLDLPATLGEIGKLGGLLMLFLLGVNHFAPSPARVRKLLVGIALAGVSVAVLGFIQAFWLESRIYGIHQVHGVFFVASFVNPNHLAGFLGLCAPIGVGLAVSARQDAMRLIWATLAVFMAVSLLLTLSRGGAIAFLAGQVFLAAGLLLRRRSPRRGVHLVLLLAAIVLSLSAWVAYDQIVTQIRSVTATEDHGSDSRLHIWRDDLDLVADFALTGAGRGAYRGVHRLYKTSAVQKTATHAENEYLQAVADWGVLGSVLIGGLLLCAGLVLRRGRFNDELAGAVAGIFAVALHNIVDFNLQTGGVAAPFAIVVGLLCARIWGPSSASRLPVAPARLRVAVALLSCGCLTATCAASHWSLQADSERIRQALREKPSALPRVAAAVMRRHPAEYYPAYQLAHAYLARQTRSLEQAFAWVNVAMYLAPSSASVHLLAARLLLALGFPTQSVAEYRHAAALGERLAVLDDLVHYFESPTTWRRATPRDPESQAALVWHLLRLNRLASAWIVAQHQYARWPDDLTIAKATAETALRMNDRELARCIATEAMEADPTRWWPYAVLARALWPHDPEGATQALRQGMALCPSAGPLTRLAANFAVAQKRFDEARELARRLTLLGQSGAANFLLGTIEEAQSRYPVALQHYRAAQSTAPHRPDYTRAVARMLEKLGLSSQAVVEYNKGPAGYQRRGGRK